MRNYHIVVVFKDAPETEDLRKGVAQLLTRHNGKIVEDQKWGSRRLPHGMQHEGVGVYALITCQMDAGRVKELSHDLQIQQGVLRFMIRRADGK